MRILVVEGSGRGFLNQYAHALALGLHEAGETVRLLTGDRDELARWQVPFEKRACLAGGLAEWWCLERQVREFAPDLVHLQWVDRPLAALAFVRRTQARGIGVVYTPHNVLPHERRWLSLPLFRALYRRVDRVVARDRHLGWALEEMLDTPQERLAYLPGSPNPLALPEFPSSYLPELAGREPGELRALFFGHGCRRKGLDGFLRVLADRCWPPSLHLVVAGEGVLDGVEGALLAEVRGRLKVTVLDRYLEPSEVAELFRHGDLLVMPYRKQCKSPLTDLAAAFGVPVLRSDRVQGAGFRDGRHGLTYPHDRPERLSELLGALVSEPGILRSLRAGLAGREAARLGVRRLADGHGALYRDLLRSRATLDLDTGLAGGAARGGV